MLFLAWVGLAACSLMAGFVVAFIVSECTQDNSDTLPVFFFGPVCLVTGFLLHHYLMA